MENNMKYESYWIVYLSNGRVLDERNFDTSPGNKTPYGQMKDYLEESDTFITNVQTVVGGRTYNLPSLSNHSNFPTKYKKISYDIIRRASLDLQSGKTILYLGISCTIKNDINIILWVNEESGNSYLEIL